MNETFGAGRLVYVVDDDGDLANSVARLLRRRGFEAEPFLDPVALLAVYPREVADGAPHCIVTDVMMGDLDGFAFADRVRAFDPAVSLIFMTAWPTTANAVDAVRRHGGLDYLEKPIDEERLLAAVSEGAAWSERRRGSGERMARLTARERQVLDLLVDGHPNKVVADRLGLSVKTVEDHRAAVLAKTGAGGLAGLIELARHRS